MTKQKDAHSEHCEMVVIGSLLGGSVVALELTEKGEGLRISAMWRKRSGKDSAETTWDIERFVWPPRWLTRIQGIYLVAEVMVHAGVGIGTRVLQRIRNSRLPSTDGTRTASTDSESATSVMPTASSSNAVVPSYSIADRSRRN